MPLSSLSILGLQDASTFGLATGASVTTKTFDAKGGRLMPDNSVGASGSSIDNRHLLLIGAGPGLGMAVARRFATGGYRVTLVARSTDGLGHLADGPGHAPELEHRAAADGLCG
jgi:hypothetical protein